MTTGCADSRSTATVRNGVGRSSKSLDVEVRRRDAAEQQFDLLSAVERARRHDAAAFQPELETRRIGARVGLAPDVLVRERRRRRTARPSRSPSSNASSSSAFMPAGECAADQPAHAGAGGHVDRDAMLLEPADDADVRDAAGAAAAERDADSGRLNDDGALRGRGRGAPRRTDGCRALQWRRAGGGRYRCEENHPFHPKLHYVVCHRRWLVKQIMCRGTGGLPPKSRRGAMTIRGARYPSLFQVNTRVWLTGLSAGVSGGRATLDDIPDAELDRLARRGLRLDLAAERLADGAAGAADVAQQSRVAARVPGDAPRPARRRHRGIGLRDHRLHGAPRRSAATRRWPAFATGCEQRGLRLMLDFVPNHMALDHPWVESIRSTSCRGPTTTSARAPQNYTRVAIADGVERVLAYGRDPYFSGWPDTLQLDYSNPRHAAGDGGRAGEDRRAVRRRPLRHGDARAARRLRAHVGPTAGAVLAACHPAVREQVPGFCFMAEVYWDLEWTLQQQGFDYAYDKRLYDRLRDGHARPVREHFHAGLDYQDRLARFLENHDEPRAAATFGLGTCTRPLPSSRSSHPDCGSSIKASSRAAVRASRRIWFARHTSRTTTR